MESLFNPLIIAAVSIAFVHVLLGPDHYLPFVALSKSNNWSLKKTISISSLCGLAHCLSSVVIGLIGVAFGITLSRIEFLEGARGDVASYLMIAFGLVYLAWSIKNLVKKHQHQHSDEHGLLIHSHKHPSFEGHAHDSRKKSNLFWGIFIVFLFGPCEPLIPLLIYPAAKANVASCVVVAVTFTVVTIFTMLGAILVALRGLSFIKLSKVEPYSHALASLVIIACGVAMISGL